MIDPLGFDEDLSPCGLFKPGNQSQDG
jgi:hypothetical protein